MTLKELKELAEKAEPGPWEINKKYDQLWNRETGYFIGTEEANCPTTQFIAAANPLIVLQLIERCEKLSEALAQTTILSRHHADLIVREALSLYGSEVPLK